MIIRSCMLISWCRRLSCTDTGLVFLVVLLLFWSWQRLFNSFIISFLTLILIRWHDNYRRIGRSTPFTYTTTVIKNCSFVLTRQKLNFVVLILAWNSCWCLFTLIPSWTLSSFIIAWFILRRRVFPLWTTRCSSYFRLSWCLCCLVLTRFWHGHRRKVCWRRGAFWRGCRFRYGCSLLA